MNETVETIAAAASSKASYATAWTFGLGWLMTSDVIFGVIGVILGLATWATNHYFKRKADKREEEYRAREKEAEQQEAEYKRRADERAAKEFTLRMRREFGTNWSDL